MHARTEQRSLVAVSREDAIPDVGTDYSVFFSTDCAQTPRTRWLLQLPQQIHAEQTSHSRKHGFTSFLMVKIRGREAARMKRPRRSGAWSTSPFAASPTVALMRLDGVL